MHRDYEGVLGEPVAQAKCHLPPNVAYTVVKYHEKTHVVSFVLSPDFDTNPEPVVGDTWSVAQDGSTRFHAQARDPWIYHHKWLMVADDYQGFDVDASKARSAWWLTLPEIDRSRIGTSSYWKRVLQRYAGTTDAGVTS